MASVWVIVLQFCIVIIQYTTGILAAKSEGQIVTLCIKEKYATVEQS